MTVLSVIVTCSLDPSPKAFIIKLMENISHKNLFFKHLFLFLCIVKVLTKTYTKPLNYSQLFLATQVLRKLPQPF
jgi:hypothetical protein